MGKKYEQEQQAMKQDGNRKTSKDHGGKKSGTWFAEVKH
jgi:hypothetical protein